MDSSREFEKVQSSTDEQRVDRFMRRRASRVGARQFGWSGRSLGAAFPLTPLPMCLGPVMTPPAADEPAEFAECSAICSVARVSIEQFADSTVLLKIEELAGAATKQRSFERQQQKHERRSRVRVRKRVPPAGREAGGSARALPAHKGRHSALLSPITTSSPQASESRSRDLPAAGLHLISSTTGSPHRPPQITRDSFIRPATHARTVAAAANRIPTAHHQPSRTTQIS